MNKVTKQYEFIVVGGGMSGVCAALAAARLGIKTALIQNRPVMGGNASSEIRININGASRNGAFKHSLNESGIIQEILHATKKINPQYSHNMLDMTLWSKTLLQENLTVYLNTHFYEAKVSNNKIVAIKAMQYTTETDYTFKAPLFADTTGDATLAFESGADYTMGREAKSKYNEENAPLEANPYTMGSTCMFTTKDMGKPVPFKPPSWAYKVTKETLSDRKINELSHGFWWIELGGYDLDVIKDSETIRNELYKWAYGVFDYIKNSGEFNADNLALDWICSVPGRRESRRILGDYVLNANDCYNGHRFPDAVAYGGWSMDTHSIGGITAKKKPGEKQEGTQWLKIKDAYAIPYRCLYSRNIENLYVGGRAISASHLAMSSTRVIATCSVIGQAIGTAAKFAVQNNLSPRNVGKLFIHDLQQELLKNDCFIPGIKADDPLDLCQKASFIASSSTPETKPENVANGWARNVEDHINGWVSEPMSQHGESLEIMLDQKRTLSNMQIAFDPNLTLCIIPTLQEKRRAKQVPELPYELARHYTIEFFNDQKLVHKIEDCDNFQRFCKFKLGQILCNRIKISILTTYGDKHARIFEVRVYE